MKRMKYCAAAALLALCLFALAACSAGAIGAGSSDGEGEGPAPEDPWGLTLSVRDVTATGATLVFTQSGGAVTGELHTGSPYTLEVLQEDTWQAVAFAAPVDNIAWEDIAYPINMDGETEMTVDWSVFYGTWPAGQYRLGKTVTDFRAAGDYDEAAYCALFEITD